MQWANHIIPATTTKLRLGLAQGHEAKALVVAHKMVVRDERKAVGNIFGLKALDVRCHKRGAKSQFLYAGEHCQ